MNSNLQPGAHPDAESLTAFAEQMLSGDERENILAHMALCGRCREVVFLAQRAAESEQPAQVQQKSQPTRLPRWFGGWRWAWIPVGALAGFIGVAVVRHLNHSESAPQQVAQSAPDIMPVQSGPAAKSAESPAPVQQHAPKRSAASELSATRKPQNKVAAEADRVLNEKKAQVNPQNNLGAAGGSFGAASPEALGGVMHGTLAARAKSSPASGPAALDQLQQQNSLQSQGVSNSVQAQQQPKDASRPDAIRQQSKVNAANQPAAAPPLRSVSETVNVQAEPVIPTSSAAATGSAPQIASLQAEERTLGPASHQLSKRKGGSITLPSSLEALSTAAAGTRTIAIDTTGALFLSKDAGKHWKAVKSQWTGRAVLVRTKMADHPNAMLTLDQQSRFELVTDKLETWVSSDGRIWTRQN